MMNRPNHQNEHGSVSAAGAALVLVVLAMAGLIIIQGISLTALSRTRDAADNAARAGSQKVNFENLFTGNELELDPIGASAAASDYLANFPELTIEAIDVDGDEITVTVSQTVVGSLGYGSKAITSTQSATATQGVTEEQQ